MFSLLQLNQLVASGFIAITLLFIIAVTLVVRWLLVMLGLVVVKSR